MNPHSENLIDQWTELAKAGHLGQQAQTSVDDFGKLPDGLPRLHKLVGDFYGSDALDPVQQEGFDSLCQIFLVAYREAKRQDSDIAMALLKSIFEDFPTTSNTNVLNRFIALANTTIAFKKVSKSGDFLLCQEQLFGLILAGNEFVSGILGYLIACWRTKDGLTFNPNVFHNNYGSKLHEFEQLTGGDNGVFYILFRVANPKLRNAIGHKSIWIEKENNEVKFTETKGTGSVYTLSTLEVIAFAALLSVVGRAYATALATATIHLCGSNEDRNKLPSHLRSVLEFEPTT